MDVGMHNGSVVGAFEWDTYGYFVGCDKLGRKISHAGKILYINNMLHSIYIYIHTHTVTTTALH